MYHYIWHRAVLMFEFIASLSILSIRILKGRFVTCVKWINILMHDYYGTQFFLKIFCIILFQLSTLERQVFDFLGYMWAPIIANTVQIICCILGIFGTYQMKAQFVVVVSCWSAKFAVFMSVQTQFCYWSNKNSVMNIFS